MKKKIRVDNEWQFFYYALQFKMGVYPSILAYTMLIVLGIFVYEIINIPCNP